ncbi:hypothetical protein XaC1_240 [Xanthomonas phage XaC1]|nr:hypothetical protein XaC1_240 [Xanthomonas phage XaC1]
MHYEHPSVIGCSNHGCILKRPVGMGTNGTCNCISTQMHRSKVLDTKRTIDYLRRMLKERDSEITELKGTAK